MTAFFHRFGQLHAWVYRHWGSRGRRFAWIPCLVLVSTGRNSGQRRESVLVYAADPDHAGLWQLVNRVNGNRYDAYQAKTTRPIALVVLSRAA